MDVILYDIFKHILVIITSELFDIFNRHFIEVKTCIVIKFSFGDIRRSYSCIAVTS